MKTSSYKKILTLAAIAAVAAPLAGFARPPGNQRPSRPQARPERCEPNRPPQHYRGHRPPCPDFRPRPYVSYWAPYCPPPPPPPRVYYGGYGWYPLPPPSPPVYYYPCRPSFNMVFTF